MKKLNTVASLFATAALAASASGAFAQNVDNWVNSTGIVWKNGTNELCWRDANWTPGYFVPTYEVIYLIAKPKFRLSPKASGHGDVWEFTQEMNNEHPAAFPVDLIDRIVSSTNAEIVLDPFMGSGTTALSAINFNRHYIGIDLSPEYCEMAEKRIKNHKAQQKLL